jgi:hypothetical protein
MEVLWFLVAAFVVLPLAAKFYVRAVNWLGALIVRVLPARVGIALGRHLYYSGNEPVVGRDRIQEAVRKHERAAGIPQRGELVD